MKKYTGILVMAFLAVTVLLCGCKTSQPSVTNNFGTMHTTVDAGPEAVIKAAQEAAKELDITVVSANVNKLAGEVVARTPADKKVSICAKLIGDNRSELNVRTGIIGESAVSLSMISKIKSKLSPPAK